MKKLALLMIIAAVAWAAAPRHSATVIETMNAGGYTYMKVEEGNETYWVAVTATPVAVGQRVTFEEQMRMTDFKSRSLNRTFDTIVFASMAYAPSQQPPVDALKPENAPKNVMQKADGGYTVAEVFAERLSLDGRQVSVRGKVTKVSKQIMKRNWVHIEDGTGGPTSDDLVFTTEQAVDIEAGDVVVATGKAAVDRDFGFGYFYPVIIEQSRFVKER